jgi:hypothetical protein
MNKAEEREELLAVLRLEDWDQEGHHRRCDEALLEYVNDPEITEAFESRGKWYG